jgi:hypothetical protein
MMNIQQFRKIQLIASALCIVVALVVAAAFKPFLFVGVSAMVIIFIVLELIYFLCERKSIKQQQVILIPFLDVQRARNNSILLVAMLIFLIFMNNKAYPTGELVLFGLFAAFIAVRSLLFIGQTSSYRIFENGVEYNRLGLFCKWKDIETVDLDSDFNCVVLSKTNMKTIRMRVAPNYFKENKNQIVEEIRKKIEQNRA